MRFLLFLFLLSSANPDGAAQACVPACGAAPPCAVAVPPHAESDAWLLVAGIVVAAAGRLAMHPRR